MKNKTPLVLMELMVMLLVFAIGAALCLRVFAWADRTSREEAQLDQAYVQIQNAAETLKHHQGDFAGAAEHLGGTWDGSRWILHMDENWQKIDASGAYLLQAEPEGADTAGLGMARLEIRNASGDILVSIRIGWQEVAP